MLIIISPYSVIDIILIVFSMLIFSCNIAFYSNTLRHLIYSLYYLSEWYDYIIADYPAFVKRVFEFSPQK